MEHVNSSTFTTPHLYGVCEVILCYLYNYRRYYVENKNIKQLNQPLGSINLTIFYWTSYFVGSLYGCRKLLSYVNIRAVTFVTKLFNERIILLAIYRNETVKPSSANVGVAPRTINPSPSAYVGDNLPGRQGILYLFYLPSTKIHNLRLLTKNCKKNTDAVGRLLIWKL